MNPYRALCIILAFLLTIVGCGSADTDTDTTATATAELTAIVQINSGGGAVSPFAADQLFSGGNPYSTGNAVATSGVANAAPAAVYQSERFGNFSYTIGGLTAGASYTVRLHFAEIWWTGTGQRVFNVSVNGTQVLANFDIVAAAGGAYKAVVRDFAANANGSGQIVVQYTSVVDNAKSSGIEILSGATGTAPSITTQPASQTVTAGQTATFSVTASGTAPLSYQWQKNGSNISGATSASYTTPATTTADSGSTFRVIVTNSVGSATSNNASLTVNASGTAPTITTQPANQTVTAGQTATFSVTASGTAPLSYQWQKNGSNISGATSASYTTPATTTADSGSTFRAIVTNSVGSATSNNATLTVTTGGGSTPLYQINSGGGAVSPFVADQLFSGGNVSSTGNAVATSGVANAAPAAVYQTERFGNFSYTIGGLTAGGSYTVRLHFAETWWTGTGQRVFNVSVNGTQVLANFDIVAAAGGAYKAVVRDFAANANGSGQIVVQYTTVVDNAKSSGIEILGSGGTSQPPTITTQPANQTVTAGQTATFSVSASGTAPLSYQWQKNGSNISGATSASYTTPATTTSDNGSTFRVIVTNSAGSATSNNATLTVTTGGGRTYTTNFPLTEDPILENGNWINGGTTGIDWGNVATTPGQTHPRSGSGGYADATALLTGSWGPNQMGQGVVWIGSPHGYPEVEIRLRSSISAHSCTGYEINFATVNGGSYVQIVRWNGPYGNFTYLSNVGGYQVNTGDVVKATIIGNVITAYKNGVQVAQATDTTYTSGSPGMGFDGGDNGDYGFTSFTASDGL